MRHFMQMIVEQAHDLERQAADLRKPFAGAFDPVVDEWSDPDHVPTPVHETDEDVAAEEARREQITNHRYD